MKNISYKEYKIYFFDDYYKEIGEKIIGKKYIVLKVYKNTIRNYVAKIKIENKVFILKSPKSEVVLPQRKFMSLLKKGEAISTLENINNLERELKKNFVKIYLAVVKKKFFIEESYILMEYIEGEILKNEEDLIKMMEIVNNIHNKKIYHGDLNASNFINTGKIIKIIDSQGKREKLSSFKRWYDIFTLKNDLLVQELKFNVDEYYYNKEKGLSFYMAYLLKNFKNLKLVKKIKEKKKELREKGWKI